MNKIAVTSEGPSLDDQVGPRFGRAAGFVIVDLEALDTHYIDNGQSQVMAQGAGIQATELVARAGVQLSAHRLRRPQGLSGPVGRRYQGGAEPGGADRARRGGTVPEQPGRDRGSR